MKRVTLGAILLGLLLWGSLVSTQPLVTRHPQQITYTDRSQMPWRNAQAHWPKQLGEGLFPIGDEHLAHTHALLRCGSYAEIAEWALCDFQILLHHNPGAIVDVQGGLFGVGGAFDWHWDATGSDVRPVMQGVIDADVTFTGSFKVYVTQSGIVNGWVGAIFEAHTQFPDGVVVVAQARDALFSVADPTAPLAYENSFPTVTAETRVGGSPSGAIYGRQNVAVVDFLPIAPISVPWSIRVSYYGYGAETAFPPATDEYRSDFDFHHGLDGTVQWSTTQTADVVNQVITFDPAVLGPGTHRYGLNRNQPNGQEQIVTLLVGDVTVAGVPPPPEPLPCVGTVQGTSIDGGTTVTATSAIVWVCR